MNKIVFVEDDQDVGELIAAYLSRHDIEVIVESRGDRAEATIAAAMPDLVMLDIMLPGKDGMTLCRDLRAGQDWSGPIVLLTSLDSDMNHILSLEMGANDYILKTTPPAVLLARLRLHLRQAGSSQSDDIAPKVAGQNALRFGTLAIDPVNRQVSLNNEVVALSTADFDLLWELATHAGSILNRDALLKTLRGVSYDGMDRSIDVAISRLRKKLLDSATEPYRIKTIRNKGYLFAPHAWDAK
jgi:two-component system response regulator RstA